jgi:hypothetical protein
MCRCSNDVFRCNKVTTVLLVQYRFTVLAWFGEITDVLSVRSAALFSKFGLYEGSAQPGVRTA